MFIYWHLHAVNILLNHYLKVSIGILSENSQLIGKKLKITVDDIFQAFQASHYQ